MKPQERLKNWKIHPSMRGQFAYQLYKLMAVDDNIFLLTGDLGYGMFDAIKEDLPDRFINCGASEQAMMDMAVGLALSDKVPVVYSITPFAVLRPFETLRTYIDWENIPVKIIGGGRDHDYEHDGISHWADDIKLFFAGLPNFKTYFPANELDVKEILYNESPCFVSLRR